jgi:hypothetical protein
MEQYFGIGAFSQDLPEAVTSTANVYETHGVFAISGDNEFQGFLWLTLNGDPIISALGTATVTIYDELDVVVTSVTQVGLTANVSGIYQLTPVNASDLAAFQHYRVKIQITHNSILRQSYRGFTIGE